MQTGQMDPEEVGRRAREAMSTGTTWFLRSTQALLTEQDITDVQIWLVLKMGKTSLFGHNFAGPTYECRTPRLTVEFQLTDDGVRILAAHRKGR